MYVCVCNAVTERHIVAAVREGATSLRHLRRDLGVTAECGRCARCAHDCLRSALAEHNSTSEASTPMFARPIFPLALEAV
ncbi:(2Fe-2S)-binding protein [Thauera sp. SDU_THAU2]|uniref:(2Fe-2S)-binding protein n=1 Tax=Thauera sp. SDU_THAU2 TaxID=3136633 RepID=UPI00311E220B